jgi:hypothetical protein
VLYMALLSAFSFLERQKKRKKDTAREPGRGTEEAGGQEVRRRGGWAAVVVVWAANGVAWLVWLLLNQSINVHRIYCSVLWLLNIILHRCGIAPAAAILEEVQPGSLEEGRAGTVGSDTPLSTG